MLQSERCTPLIMDKIFEVKQEMKLVEFLNAAYFQTSRMKLMRRLFLFSIIVSIFSALLDFSSTLRSVITWYRFIFNFLFYPLFLLAFFFVLITIGAVLLMTLRPDHFKDVTYYFTHWGMEKIGKGIEFTRPWSKFLRFRESSHFIFLYITENDAHIIQKRMFKSNQDLQNFKQFIAHQIGKD